MTAELFEKFVQERTYLHNLSHHTIRLYKTAWGKWLKYGPDPISFVSGMRQAGITATGCNIHIRSLNAFFRWSGGEPLPRLKEEFKVLPVLQNPDIAKLIAFKPRKSHLRTHTLLLTLLDTGMRIDEALSLKVEDIDFENLLMKVRGKGAKERMIPFSFELRKVLWKYRAKKQPSSYWFPTSRGDKQQHRNVLRDSKGLLVKLGINPPKRLLHSFRHTFAVNYLRQGGGVFHLQKALGHSTLEMSRRYANLLTEDLQAVQQKVSFLNQFR